MNYSKSIVKRINRNAKCPFEDWWLHYRIAWVLVRQSLQIDMHDSGRQLYEPICAFNAHTHIVNASNDGWWTHIKCYIDGIIYRSIAAVLVVWLFLYLIYKGNEWCVLAYLWEIDFIYTFWPCRHSIKWTFIMRFWNGNGLTFIATEFIFLENQLWII